MKIPDAKAAVDKEWEKLEKLPAWQVTKFKSKKEVIEKAQTEERSVQYATLMDLCLKDSKLEQKFPRYKGRVVLLVDGAKDDSRSYAVCLQSRQGSSASLMTAATGLDVIVRLLGCEEASDAVSAYNQVKMEEAPKLLKTQLCFWKGICQEHPLAGLIWERQFD